MTEKVMEILGSVRFWQVTLIAILAIIDGQAVVPVIQVWLAAVAAIGTLDSVATRISGKEMKGRA